MTVNKAFSKLIQRIHFYMKQFMNNDFFKIFLDRIYCIQHQNSFSIIGIYLEISSFIKIFIRN